MGNLKKYLPITFATMATGWLAISGIPIFAGFFSKDEILYKTFAADNYFPAGAFPGNEILWVVAVITAILTAIYMTRMMVMTFWGTERFHEALPDGNHPHDAAHAEENAFAHADASDATVPHGDSHALAHHHDELDAAHDDHDDEDEHHHALAPDFKPHESPWVMTVPLIILAFLSTFGGLIGVPYALSSLVGAGEINAFEHTLEPVVAKVPAGLSGAHSSLPAAEAKSAVTEGKAYDSHSPEVVLKERLLAALSVILAALGIAAGWFIYRKIRSSECLKFWKTSGELTNYTTDTSSIR
jgi:NADH-quinone oxidoreductase subunit L